MIESLEARQMLARALPFPFVGPIKIRPQAAAHQTQTQTPTHSAGHSDGVASIALTQPTKPDLADVSDHGFFNNDDITNETSPMISGTATPTTLVEVLLNDVVITTVASDFNGLWTTTLNGLNDGLSAITVRETDGLGTYSATSEPLNLSIDTVQPAMLSSAFFWQN